MTTAPDKLADIRRARKALDLAQRAEAAARSAGYRAAADGARLDARRLREMLRSLRERSEG